MARILERGLLVFCWVGMASSGAAGPVLGLETVVKNDSVTDFSQTAVQSGFDNGERVAAWLTSTCGGTVVAEQVLWRSASGGTGTAGGGSIQVAAAGSFPIPGAELALITSAPLQDGLLNEFRFLDAQQTIPLAVPVAEGQRAVVSYRFGKNPGGLSASVVTDLDGCQEGKNGRLLLPVNKWTSGCQAGVPGDFVIRAVVDCDPLPPDIFADGFETGDTSAWTRTVG